MNARIDYADSGLRRDQPAHSQSSVMTSVTQVSSLESFALREPHGVIRGEGIMRKSLRSGATVRKNMFRGVGFFIILTAAAMAAGQLDFSKSFQLSNDPALGFSAKPKLVRLANGRLVTVYADAIENSAERYVYDIKSDILRPARDIFARYCNSNIVDCGNPAHWSTPVNLSNSSGANSASTDWDGERDGNNLRKPYSGDSGKPNVFSAGSRIVVTWTDKYCPDGDVSTPAIDEATQRTVTYIERDFIEVPFSCVWVASSANGGVNWTPARQLSSGHRDAIQDVNRGIGSGHWAITWQEDPTGLKLGEAEGPGDGGSGAKVSKGTDIWYTFADPEWFDSDAMDGFGFWHAPVRLTDNATGQSAAGHHNLVRELDGTPVAGADMDGGIAGAARANLAIVDDSARSRARIALVAYEETKGSGGTEEGKVIRYHQFPWNDPAASNPAGCLISDPGENARRVRLVRQNGPGPLSGLRLAIFWKQGLLGQGGPSDIMLRFGFAGPDKLATGLRPVDLVPQVDPFCETSIPAMTRNLTNAAALNISAETETATDANLLDPTFLNAIEDARAHRAVLRKDDFYISWSYTPDWAVATYTDLENYNFWLRHYSAATNMWLSPVNLSNIDDVGINVKEPRLIGMPGNGPGCTGPLNPKSTSDCQNPDVLLIAWGTETNVYSHLGGAQDLEIYYTRTTDKGQTLEPVQVVANRGEDSRFEAQIRPTPDGSTVFSVWGQTDAKTGMTTAYGAGALYRSDTDNDGLLDNEDNCLLIFNPDQVDVDDDGIGNICDSDFNQDCAVNLSDLLLMKRNFGGSEPLYDLNSDGAIDLADLGIMRSYFLGPPGPSGLPNNCD